MPAGTVVSSGSLVSPGGQQGIPGPNAVSTDAGNQATFGSDSRLYVPDPTPVITSVRLRSFNAVGNPSFEVDQRNVGTGLASPANSAFLQDRWALTKVGTMVMSTQQNSVPITGNLVVPGTSFKISNNYLLVTLTTQEASLAAGDLWNINQNIEGPLLREIAGDVSSLSLLVASSVAGLKFSVAIRDPATVTKSLVKLCTIPSANTWTLISLPNLPQFPSGNFAVTPGAAGYQLSICLACGSTFTAPVADTWQSGNFVAAPGMSNFAAQAVNSTFQVGFIQHEPGSQCTTLIDKPFTQNYDECLRYYQKSFPYSSAIGSVSSLGAILWSTTNASTTNLYTTVRFPKVMAKSPTVYVYSTATGALNQIRNISGGVDVTASSVAGLGDSGYGGVITGTAVAASSAVSWNHVADTGW